MFMYFISAMQATSGGRRGDVVINLAPRQAAVNIPSQRFGIHFFFFIPAPLAHGPKRY